MAEYQAANSPEQNYIIDSDQSYQSNYQQVLRGPQCTARESDMGLLEIYQFEARTGDPIRDLKGGACSLHLESGSCSFPPLPSPLNFSGNCQCQCSCSPCPPSPCCPPPCLPVCPCYVLLDQLNPACLGCTKGTEISIQTVKRIIFQLVTEIL